MIPTSDGSQPDKPSGKPVSEFISEFIQKLQQERQPGVGDVALKGAVGQSLKDNPQYYA